MPQCIAQQDQSVWLDTMTKCTIRRCTRHFGFICTQHQWLTQLSCLNTAFSSDVVRGYLPYCSRSILAKAQLYLWIRNITGRTWLADVGDANNLESLSSASLVRGYADVGITDHAPSCLTGSVSAESMEPFQHVMASCSFTSTTQHTGNVARPWEYNESLRSMIALDFETVGYDLTRGSIGYGDYFDKECFCSAFRIDTKKEPCSGSDQLELTKERLWINATCGPASLPVNWTDTLKTTKFDYIPMKDWQWPTCVTDMPKKVTGLTDRCATEACELSSSGYCKVKRAVDRACFCHDISYDSCKGSCQFFETRIEYVKWLHNLCGVVQDWKGLPKDWQRLAAPISLDMIPWRWTIKRTNSSSTAPLFSPIDETGNCALNNWKLGIFALVNMATFLSIFLQQRSERHPTVRRSLWNSPLSWFLKGVSIASFQLFANWLNASLVQSTPGYENVPVFQLMLLWCTIPRLPWLPVLLLGIQPLEAVDISAVASVLLAEIILQALSSYYMIMTVHYGIKHNFYLGVMDGTERETPAKLMYAGALLWLFVIMMAIAQLMRTALKMKKSTGSKTLNIPRQHRSQRRGSSIIEALMIRLDEHCTRLWQKLAHTWIKEYSIVETTPLMTTEGGHYTGYGTLPVKSQYNMIPRDAFLKLYTFTAMTTILLWVAQWLFWGGFVGLASDEYVLAHKLDLYIS
jgi:hypothetical protein